MRKYQIFLTYYTLAFTIGFTVWAIGWGPKPQSLFVLLALVPVAVYFWLIFFGDKSLEVDNSTTKIPIIILATIFVSTISILGYSFTRPPENLSAEINLLRQEMSKLKTTPAVLKAATVSATVTVIPTQSPTPTPSPTLTKSPIASSSSEEILIGLITVKDSATQTPVYSADSLTGKTVGKLEFGKLYPFLNKSKTWYLVLLDDKQGYVSAKQVKEFAN